MSAIKSMVINKYFLVSIACILIIAGVFIYFLKKDDIENYLEKRNKFTLQLIVPDNTFDEDIIYINITDIPPAQKDLPMEKVSPKTYEISLTEEDIGNAYDFPAIKYRYNRNGWGFSTAEYLPDNIEKDPDIAPENENSSNYSYRVAEFKRGKVVKDTVERWRWFPEGEIVHDDISALGPLGSFSPRVLGREFLSGAGIEDLYLSLYDPFFDHVADRIKKNGFNFIVLYPPYQMKEVEGIPKVVNDLENNPNYPNDEKLKEHIKAFKNRGLKVFMEPQLCCEGEDYIDKSQEWWNLYIDEAEKFIVHQAEVAQKSGVDAFLFDTYNIDQELPFYSRRMDKMLSKVKKRYKGEIFTKVVPFMEEGAVQPAGFIPDLDRVSWGDDVDFFVYDAEGSLSSKSDPTEKELAEGAGKNLDIVKAIYDRFGKPILVRSSYFAVKESWKSTGFYQEGIIPGEEKSEHAYEGHEFSSYDQARVDNAFFEAIRTRPWVIGFVHFGYTHWEMPTLPHWSIRGRTAEDLWVKWNKAIFGN